MQYSIEAKDVETFRTEVVRFLRHTAKQVRSLKCVNRSKQSNALLEAKALSLEDAATAIEQAYLIK